MEKIRVTRIVLTLAFGLGFLSACGQSGQDDPAFDEPAAQAMPGKISVPTPAEIPEPSPEGNEGSDNFDNVGIIQPNVNPVLYCAPACDVAAKNCAESKAENNSGDGPALCAADAGQCIDQCKGGKASCEDMVAFHNKTYGYYCQARSQGDANQLLMCNIAFGAKAQEFLKACQQPHTYSPPHSYKPPQPLEF